MPKLARCITCTDLLTSGAVLSRVSNKATVVSFQAVRHYGVQGGAVFDPIVDSGRPTYLQVDDGSTRVAKARIAHNSARSPKLCDLISN